MRRTVAALFVLATAALPAIAGSEPAPAPKHVEKTFLIPADDPAGKAQIHHIRADIRPFLTS